MAWRVFSQKGLRTGVSSSPQHPGLSILGSTSTNPEQLKKDFGCCCLKKGDCILSISVIDEDTTLGYRNPQTRDNDYAEFRKNYPKRNLLVLRPQDPPAWYCSNTSADCSVYYADQWRDILARPNPPFGPLVLPEGWGESADGGQDFFETVKREDGDRTPDDWYEIVYRLGLIDPDGTNTRDPSIVTITKTFGKIAVFLDNSGSMTTYTVRNSWELFQKKLKENLDITRNNGRLIMRPGSSEIWIKPHVLIAGEDCEADRVPA